MDHKRAQRLVAIYDDLSAVERTALEAHLAACSECRSLKDDYSAVDLLLQSLDESARPEEIRASFYREIHKDKQVNSQKHIGLNLGTIARQGLALGLLAVLVGGLWWITANLPGGQIGGVVSETSTPRRDTPQPTLMPTSTPAPAWSSREVQVIESGLSELLHLSIAASGNRIGAGDGDNINQIREIKDGGQVGYWRLPSYQTGANALSQDGEWLAAASTDYQSYIMLYPANGDDPIRLDEPSGRISTLSFSPDGQLLAVSEDVYGSTIYLYRAPDWSFRSISTDVGNIQAVEFFPDGTHLAASLGAGGVAQIDLLNGEVEYLPFSPDAIVTVLALSPEGTLLAGTSLDQKLIIYSLDHQTEPMVFDGNGRGEDLIFSADGQALAAIRDDGTAQIWEMQDGDWKKAFETDLSSQHNAQGRLASIGGTIIVAVGSVDGEVHVFHLEKQ